MTSDQRFERDLPDLLIDAYVRQTPDYRDDIVQLVARTPQRPAWMFPERWIPMTMITLVQRAKPPLPWRTIGLLAMIALLLAAGVALLAGSQPRPLPAPFGPAGNGALVVDEGGDIFLIDPGTGAKTLAIGGAGVDSQARFSRDGTSLAFYRDKGGEGTLWIADNLGRSPRELSTAGLSAPTDIIWAPDGRSILVNGVHGSESVMAVVPTDGRAPRIIDVGMSAESPTWLPPSGAEIAFRAVGPDGFGLSAVRSDGSGVVRSIVPATGQGNFDVLFIAPSPDGREIAYQWRDDDGTQKIYVVATSGGTPQPITTIESVLPMWSPDGAWIAFFSGNGLTYVVPADGSAGQVLVSPREQSGFGWTPDGKRLAIVDEVGKAQLIDPLGGPPVEARWSSAEMPDWQRLALKP